MDSLIALLVVFGGGGAFLGYILFRNMLANAPLRGSVIGVILCLPCVLVLAAEYLMSGALTLGDWTFTCLAAGGLAASLLALKRGLAARRAMSSQG